MRRPGPARGFTLAEMLAVITMIGIFSVAASPVFINMMRDRRINSAAMELVDMYRTARTQALARGMPVLITWDATAGAQKQSSGVVTILEPVLRDVPDLNTSCTGVNWEDTKVTYPYMRFDAGDGRHERAVLTFTDDKGGSPKKADICFSPRGRAFLRTDGGGFTELNGVPSFTVANGGNGQVGTGLVRTIFIPPNGVARIGETRTGP